ncbi:bifunctional diaminohydroxyphosphoribosylaminopyrimidine deaminase/5-amino-6-(5-phosphoribosylamino)uracil reductase RibD [Subtercola lobariae]|nr:bifunctional diaminohydroxyphosphoribosylaminopyrimidine deaminase/5-amino-6-(5-phosphoribosylamino)uracil reductase RibD [Subtercola lobariae]
MRRAIELSQNGPAWGINPQVGCVLLSPDGETLAEGWHRGAGTPHAEVDALTNLAAMTLPPATDASASTCTDAAPAASTTPTPAAARGAIAVVTLEPCNHVGRTGPCSQALIAAGIAEVYFAVSDPGASSGGGADTLAAAGVRVHSGVLADEVEQSIHSWLTATRTGRPFVTVKWASSLDGRAAAADGTSQWVTGSDARADVHARRSRSDAILVGTGTLAIDDPSLTARTPEGTLLPHQPVAVVIGERGIHPGAAVLDHPEPALEFRTHDLPAVLDDLFARGFRSAFVEGGPTLASALLAAGLVDELVVYVAPLLLGGPRTALTDLGITSMVDARQLDFVSVDLLGPDLRLVARPRRRATDVTTTTSRAVTDDHTDASSRAATGRGLGLGEAAAATSPLTLVTPKETPDVHRNH